MSEFAIDKEHELIAVHKALMQAKFPETFDIHKEVMSSPVISDIMNRLADALSETDSHSGRKEWEDWRKLDTQDHVYREVYGNVVSDRFYRELKEDKKKEYVKNCFAPYYVNDEMVQQLINNADKQMAKAEKSGTPDIIITCSDCEKQIDNVHLHDAGFLSMSYDLFKKQITLVLDCHEWESADYTLQFKDVYYHEMTGCDFWGGGYNVVSWYKCDVSDIYDKLKLSEKCIPISFDGFFGVEVLFNSGDKLRILCREIAVKAEK